MTYVDVVAYIRTYVQYVQLLHAMRMSHALSIKLQRTARIRCACMCMCIHVHVDVHVRACTSDLILSVFACCRLYHDCSRYLDLSAKNI